MNTDIRVAVGLWDHPKLRRLETALGDRGVLCLLRLWTYTAMYRPGGNLSDMSDGDIEWAARWKGAKGKFVRSLIDLRWLDEVCNSGGTREQLTVHDWSTHNAWAFTAPERSKRASDAARAKWAKAQQPVMHDACATQCGTHDLAMRTPNAPSPSPSPSPSPTPTPSPEKKEEPPIAPLRGASVGEDENGNPPPEELAETSLGRKKRKPLDVTTPYSPDFEQAWAAYPVAGRKGKGAAFRAWERYRLAGRLPDAETFTASVRAHEERDDKWLNGFVPNMATYLNQARWEDALEAVDVVRDGGEPPPLMPFDHPDILECHAKVRSGEIPPLTEVLAEMAGARSLATMDAERKRRNDEFMWKYGLKRVAAAASD